MLQRITLATAVVALIFSLINFFGHSSNGKVAYVNNYELFQQFEGKKELEQELLRQDNGRKAVLDSLSLMINLAQGKADQTRLKELVQKQELLANEFAEQQSKEQQTSTDQIWKQINEATQLFGKQKGYDYILGASGNGSIMYGNEVHDVTKELVTFLNQHYQGK